MKTIVTGEVPFKALKSQFMIGPSEGGYTLAYSADGVNYTNYSESTPAGENAVVNGAVQYAYFKLVGNTGDVIVIR